MENLQTQTQAPPHNQTLQTDQHQQHPPVAVVECPRCNSMNTKFCYYNNYNLSQPRHFCKNCRRYWTKGGALRNIPVGGGTRKNSKRATLAHTKRPTKTIHVSSAPQAQSVSSVEREAEAEGEGDHSLLLDCGVGVGSFSSLLASNGHLGNYCHGSFLGGLGSGEGQVNSSSVDSGGIGIGNGNGNGNDALWPGSWADLSIYTPGPTFQ